MTMIAGVRVLELSSRTACRACGSLFAQLGAEVIIAQCTPRQAAAQSTSARPDDGLRAGKQHLLIDDRNAGDRALLDELVTSADIVLWSSDERPWSSLAADWHRASTNPRRVTIDISSGLTTAAGPASESVVQALTGAMDTTGFADGPPLLIPGEPFEFIAALHALAGGLAALLARARDGTGQMVDITLLDCAFASHAVFAARLLVEPNAVMTRSGNRHPLASPWNVFETRDGWLLICLASDGQWQRLCGLMNRTPLARDSRFATGPARLEHLDELEAVVRGWVGGLATVEVSEHLLRASIPCGPIAPLEGYPREPNLDHRQMIVELGAGSGANRRFIPGPPLRASLTPGLPASHLPATDGARAGLRDGTSWRTPNDAPAAATGGEACEPGSPPLTGIRVIELGHFTTAPLAARYLANLGAEVIKIEPPGGEAMRAWQPRIHGQGAFFALNNAGKRSLRLDLKQPRDMERLRSLLATSDVLIENLKPGALERMGLSYASMHALNPRLVYCSVSGFGVDSAYPGRPAYDTVVQAMSGIMAAVGGPGTPVKTGMSYADLLGANFSVAATLGALLYRSRTSRGQHLDISMQDLGAWATQLTWAGGGEEIESRAPVARVLACADGHVLAEEPTRLSLAPTELAGLTRAACERRWPGQVHAVLSVGESMRTASMASQVLRVRDAAGREWPVLANPIGLQRTPCMHGAPRFQLGEDEEALLNASNQAGHSPSPDFNP